MPGSGAALTRADNARIVADLQELGANVTRSHYVLNEDLLSRLDRAGILVWNQAPIWQRDRGANILRIDSQRRRAWETVRRTVIAARSHPSVITHSVANELWSRPDERPGITRRYLEVAQREARELDPTLPISVDINGRPHHPEQFTYHDFDMLGINQYFGWYGWVENFDDLPLYLQEMRDLYPQLALVMTEFGAEARPELADAPVEQKGSYAFQSFHFQRTMDVCRRRGALGRDLLDRARVRDLPGLARRGRAAAAPVRAQHAPPEGPADLRGREEARLVPGARPLHGNAAVPVVVPAPPPPRGGARPPPRGRIAGRRAEARAPASALLLGALRPILAWSASLPPPFPTTRSASAPSWC